jgi:DNA-binding NtrC family response regulator
VAGRRNPDDVRTALQGRAYRSPTRRRCLTVIGDGVYATHALPEQGDVVIGRASGAAIRVDAPLVSRRHLVLHVGERVSVEDLGSSNGTRVGERVLGSGEVLELGAGDVIEIGPTLLIVQEQSTAPGEERPASVGENPMQALERLVERIAVGMINVLLLGETGVGKEVFAERIHAVSPRADKPLVRLNCAALSETLLESELFGHERGAFTGAVAAKPGLLETAEGGTVFLDEIGDLPLALQAKLLRVLEARQVLRVGGLKPRPIDVRFVSATHRDLEALVGEEKFRQDLFFRLNGVTLLIPPLRERVGEIAPLARSFAARAATQSGWPAPELAPEAIAVLERHHWPGNIRELRNVVERAVLLSGGARVELAHLPAQKTTEAEPPAVGLRASRNAHDREVIVDALARCDGNQTRAAKELGISRRTLINRIEELGIARPRKR